MADDSPFDPPKSPALDELDPILNVLNVDSDDEKGDNPMGSLLAALDLDATGVEQVLSGEANPPPLPPVPIDTDVLVPDDTESSAAARAEAARRRQGGAGEDDFKTGGNAVPNPAALPLATTTPDHITEWDVDIRNVKGFWGAEEKNIRTMFTKRLGFDIPNLSLGNGVTNPTRTYMAVATDHNGDDQFLILLNPESWTDDKTAEPIYSWLRLEAGMAPIAWLSWIPGTNNALSAGHMDGEISFFQINENDNSQGQHKHQIKSHTPSFQNTHTNIRQLAFSKGINKSLLATGGDDGTVSVFDTATGQLVMTRNVSTRDGLVPHPIVSSVNFDTYNGADMVSFTVQQDGRVVFWDVRMNGMTNKPGQIGVAMQNRFRNTLGQGCDREDLDLYSMMEESPNPRPKPRFEHVLSHCKMNDNMLFTGDESARIRQHDIRMGARNSGVVKIVEDPYLSDGAGIMHLDFNEDTQILLASGYTDFTAHKINSRSNKAEVLCHSISSQDTLQNTTHFSCTATFFDPWNALVTDSEGIVKVYELETKPVPAVKSKEKRPREDLN